MKKRISGFSTALILALSLLAGFPSSVSAATYTISADGTYDMSLYTVDSTLTIATGLNVTLTNTGSVSRSDFQVICQPNVNLTVDGVIIDNTGIFPGPSAPVTFNGETNTLTLAGTSSFTGGLLYPGVRVESGITLQIDGTGTLNADGGVYAAGIGSAHLLGAVQTAGTIIINDGIINARGGVNGSLGYDAAGIGGAAVGCFESIVINGGTVTATGGMCAAGIGSGHGYTSSCTGTITINGGAVYAYGGDDATDTYNGTGHAGAAIGSGTNSSCGDISITGGTVTAIAGDWSNFGGAAGIGSGGESAAAGNIDISGGVVYASGTAGDDIGDSDTGTAGIFTISGTCAVILERDICKTPILVVPHTHKRYDDAVNPMLFTGGLVYGITADPLWVNAHGGYFLFCNLYYDANGGTGTVPDTVLGNLHYTMTSVVSDAPDLTYDGFTFTGWNTIADGSGTPYV